MGIKSEIIDDVQKVADTNTQKIDASIVSRVVSLTLDALAKKLERKHD